MRERRRVFTWKICLGCIQGLAVLACGGSADRRPAERVPGSPADGPSDSLVLTTGAGQQVWFTLARPATGGNAKQCVERGLEIRAQGRRTRVPLLYTGTAPELINDSTIRAILWKDCEPGEPYLVDLRTGQPVPERGGNKL